MRSARPPTRRPETVTAPSTRIHLVIGAALPRCSAIRTPYTTPHQPTIPMATGLRQNRFAAIPIQRYDIATYGPSTGPVAQQANVTNNADDTSVNGTRLADTIDGRQTRPNVATA